MAAVRRVLDGPAIEFMKAQGPCVPVAAVFGLAKPADAPLTQIGVELVKVGLPANASWYPPDNSPRDRGGRQQRERRGGERQQASAA